MHGLKQCERKGLEDLAQGIVAANEIGSHAVTMTAEELTASIMAYPYNSARTFFVQEKHQPQLRSSSSVNGIVK